MEGLHSDWRASPHKFCVKCPDHENRIGKVESGVSGIRHDSRDFEAGVQRDLNALKLQLERWKGMIWGAMVLGQGLAVAATLLVSWLKG